MKLAVLGGSFNPIHIGHLSIADEVCSRFGYDRILFIPTSVSPHKVCIKSVSDEDRFAMVNLACADDERFKACDIELKRSGVSYTFDTICQLEQQYKNILEGKIGLILGQDLFSGFHLWHRAKELSEKCTLILAVRPQSAEDTGFVSNASGKYKEIDHSQDDFFDISTEPLFDDALKLENCPLEVSSSEIRRRVGDGRAFRYLVNKGVFEYIKERNLYGKR